jgi:quinoprotein dehydrogenase-associated probable ABC transporter substrate-binding protein
MRRLAELAIFAVAFAFSTAAAGADEQSASGYGELRVCADPNNLPFSNKAGEGFENKLAGMIAERLGRKLSYTWWAQRRGFVRHTLKAGECDLIIGVPAHYSFVETTIPYYRSTYVFVTQQSRHLDLASLTDARLRNLKIGVHLIGDDGNNPPPADALGQQGIVDNVRGFPIYGDYRNPNPPARLIEAVADGEIDVAAAWGPLSGYFAKHSKTALAVTPIADGDRFAPQRFQFDIAMGVRKGDHEFRDQLNEFITHNREEIKNLLKNYDVPLVETPFAASGAN